MRRKYVVIDGWFGVSAILFPEAVPHKTVVWGFHADGVEVLGAGFYTVADGVVTCYDKSVGLGVASRGQVDADIIQKQLIGDSNGN